ncbi:secreted frizzled-related protein 5 [Rhinoderma darwinii]|uniref:secreted frizzled-related protein 5 n=1 Tax=Rhinoderma darwinii TaxID=43563 RepID=UPI003F677CBE
MQFHWNVVALLNFGFILWSSAEEYDYYSWQSDNFQNGRFYTKQSKCVDIPQDLHLCHNVGYKKMRLPNLLDHESMPEVKQQASSWVPLLAKRCHRDTQLFLCSLFAPICLERPIYPCRSLCEVVRDSCAPVMESYGFPWPEMLNCNKFPLDNDLCITVQYGTKQVTQPSGTKICTQCEIEQKSETMRVQYCASDFVLRMRIKEVKIENGDLKLIAAQKKKKVLKAGKLKRKEFRKLVLYIKNAVECQCPQLDNLSGSFLIMGRKVENKLLLTAIYKWDKKSKDMKYAVNFMFSYPCSETLSHGAHIGSFR